MPYPFITSTQLSNRMSERTFTRAFDDNADGVADTDPVAQVLADSSGHVAGYVQGSYPMASVSASTPPEVVRLTLDVAVAMAAIRSPEAMPGFDGVALMKLADKHLESLRDNKTSLGTDASPAPAANEGGDIFPDPETEDVYTFARDGFGDF